MRNTLETRLGIFVALAVIAAVLILETVGGVDRFRRGYHLNADFRTVQERSSLVLPARRPSVKARCLKPRNNPI